MQRRFRLCGFVEDYDVDSNLPPVSGVVRPATSNRRYDTVAEGVVFSDGTVSLRWQRAGAPSSFVNWNSLDDALAVHIGLGSWIVELID